MNLKPIKANMNEVEVNGKKVLFSYQTPVACTFNTPEGRVFQRTSKNWSRTTNRHINSWLPKDQAEEKDQEYFDNLLNEVK